MENVQAIDVLNFDPQFHDTSSNVIAVPMIDLESGAMVRAFPCVIMDVNGNGIGTALNKADVIRIWNSSADNVAVATLIDHIGDYSFAMVLVDGQDLPPLNVFSAEAHLDFTVHVLNADIFIVFDQVESIYVDWGDGHFEPFTGDEMEITHSYAVLGTYTVKIYASDFTVLTELGLANNGVSAFPVNNTFSNLVFIDLSNNLFNSAGVDFYLSIFDGFGKQNGTLNLQGQTPAAPPDAGAIGSKTSLIARGWDVFTD